MHRTLLALSLLVACGGAQRTTGPVYCESYEDRYLGDCQRDCEADTQDVRAGEEEIARCEKKCLSDLAEDGNFSSDCPERAAALGG